MNYLKLYESFKINKYETDYLKYDELEREYMLRKKELLRVERDLKELDNDIKNNNKLDDMLNHIFDKLADQFSVSGGYQEGEDIIEYLSPKLDELITGMYISYIGPQKDDFYGNITGIINEEIDGWSIHLSDYSLHTFYDIPSNNCYHLLKYLMDDDEVSGILNTEVFRKINK